MRQIALGRQKFRTAIAKLHEIGLRTRRGKRAMTDHPCLFTSC